MSETQILATDVLIEILLRLPFKQICQLKLVSRQWLLTISSSIFKILFNEKSMRRPRLLIVEQSHISRTIHMSTIDILTGYIHRELGTVVKGRSYSFLSICNLFYYNNERYTICNPTTNEHVHIPGDASHIRASFYCGYIQQTNEYKIVLVTGQTKLYEDDKAQFQILTLKDGEPIPTSWRIVENDAPTNWSYKPQSVSIKCAIYWLVYDKNFRGKSIISIDLKSERFTTISFPEISPAPDYQKYNHDEQLTEIKGNLCLAHLSKGHPSPTLTLYVLNDYENHIWIKECSIDLYRMDDGFTIVGYFPLEDENGEMIFHWYTGDLLAYNINESRFRRIVNGALPRGCHVSLYYDRLFSFGGSI